MEPKRVLLIEPVPLVDGHLLPQWTYVWKLRERNDGSVLVEYRNREYKIPASYTIATPVPVPSKGRLLALDSCFAELKNLQELHRNDSSLFSVYRCSHGNYFLADERGGIGMFTLWVYLGPVKDQSPDGWESLWRKYHAMPVDAVYHLGIGCC